MKRYIKMSSIPEDRLFEEVRRAVDTTVLSYYMRGGCSEAECRKYFNVKIETRPGWYDDGSDMHMLTVYLDGIDPDEYESEYLAKEFEEYSKSYQSNPEDFEDITDIEEPIIYGNVEDLQYNYLDPLIKKFNNQYYFEKESSYVLICNLDT